MSKEDYVARISTATPLGLVIINYELILDNCAEAEDALQNGDFARFEARVTKAKDFLMLLMKSLNFEYEISKELLRTYIYINSLFIKAFFSRKPDALLSARGLLTQMLADWRYIEKEEVAPAVMKNAQKVYAGFTYKNGELAEYSPNGENRGFKA